ncbi:N-acetyltransferase, partial [Mesorhizobium sp. M2D.F.Ca.ET.145.01.1.1]
MNTIEIGPLTASRETLAMLTDLLVETVAAGGSVSFMHPLAAKAARAFWETSLAAAARGERMVLGAWDGGALVGTVTLLLDCPPNQPHRAESAKLMTSVEDRGRGVGTRLMRAAERLAAEKGRTLLVL